jgi:uncharacterized protein YmfQ (DUF2313 family)
MVMMPAAAYARQLQSLLPTGPAWPRDPDTVLTQLLESWAEEFARLDARAHQLLDETDPRTAYELLADWERVLGLPDPCTAAATTLSARRLACWRKLAYQSGQTPAFYIEMAAAIGFEIEINEFDPDVDAYDASLAAAVAAGRWRHIWRVHVLNAGSFNHMIAGDPAGTALLVGDAALDLECLIRAAKPAHSHVIFSYPEED